MTQTRIQRGMHEQENVHSISKSMLSGKWLQCTIWEQGEELWQGPVLQTVRYPGERADLVADLGNLHRCGEMPHHERHVMHTQPRTGQKLGK